MSKSGVGGLVVLAIIGVAAAVMWKPFICPHLNTLSGGSFDFCTFSSGAATPTETQVSPITGGRHERHDHHAVASTKARREKAAHPKHPHHAAASTAKRRAKAVQTAKDSATAATNAVDVLLKQHPTTTTAGLAQVFDFRMSI
jgi:hypothetical protein